MRRKQLYSAGCSIVLSICVLNGPSRLLSAQSQPAAIKEAQESAAQTASLVWLKLIDTAQYQASWTSAAFFFRRAVTEPQWEQAIQSARSPLGKLISRQLKRTTFTHTLPGAPDGEYMVMQYDAALENKASAVETLTASHEKDGTWQVCGYFIR